MFTPKTYVRRREVLRQSVGSGILLFLGNEESPMNYSANVYRFRQDSTFLYYWGLDDASLAAVLDIDNGKEMIFGNDPTVDEIVWTGPQVLMKDKAAKAGVAETFPFVKLGDVLSGAIKQGRKIHFVRQYRPENILRIQELLGIPAQHINASASVELTRAVVAQRSVKSDEEITEIEHAVNLTRDMQLLAMRTIKPGIVEREIAGAMEGLALSKGVSLSFPIIFSVHGETLHNPYHENKMKSGNIVVNDCGAESSLHYAGDLTRTLPVSGKFTQKQKEIYQIVLDAQKKAIAMVAPGVPYKGVHRTSCLALASGLKDLGLMKGNVDEAVEVGAHAMFFQCGTGHMTGLDVHDMENLGEEFVGYDEHTQRSKQFGLCYLRLAKPLQPGFVVTVEPGIYFIPALYHSWKAEKKFEQFLNYAAIARYMDFGGVRIEDDVLVLPKGNRIVGKKLAKTIPEVEAACS
jgi:Xaa-Pro dipeptidase